MEKIFLIPTRWAKGKIPCAFSVECCKIDKRTMYYKVNRKYLINKNDLDKIMNYRQCEFFCMSESMKNNLALISFKYNINDLIYELILK